MSETSYLSQWMLGVVESVVSPVGFVVGMTTEAVGALIGEQVVETVSGEEVTGAVEGALVEAEEITETLSAPGTNPFASFNALFDDGVGTIARVAGAAAGLAVVTVGAYAAVQVWTVGSTAWSAYRLASGGSRG